MKSAALWFCPLALAIAACSPHHHVDAGPDDGGDEDAGTQDAGSNDGGVSSRFCELPGSYVFSGGTRTTVPGGTATDFSWLTLPSGFCVHEFANVPDARQLRFAPGGELFVTSPTTGTTGGNATAGLASIVVVPDDNHDGVGDSNLIYKNDLPSTQGILFANGSFYYQDGTMIMREPYTSGQRVDNGQASIFMDITYYISSLHWPKTLDISDMGEIYVGNGGDQGEVCEQPMPTHGGILIADGTTCADGGTTTCGGTPIVKGMRNPVAIKCHRDGHDHCFADELSLDYSASQDGREKLVPIHSGDNWGFPCCATQGVPYAGITPVPDCSIVTADTNSFVIGNTPFGMDFVDDQFPTPWDHKVLVALHGEAGSWAGARVVAIATDPSTGMPYPSSTVSGVETGNISDFAIGWDDGTFTHGRPADVEVAPDGRVFIANDVSGEIFWIAPVAQ